MLPLLKKTSHEILSFSSLIAWFLWPALHSARFFADVEMLNVLTHEFRPVSLPFYRIVKLIQFLLRIELLNIELPIPTLHFVSQPFHLMISFVVIIHTSTCTERPIAVEFFFGWMGTASPVNNHGRITSGGFYRSGVETTCSLSHLLCLVFLFPIALCSDTGETLAPSVCRSVRKHPGPVTKGGMLHSVNNLTQQYGNCLRNFCSMNQAILIDYLEGRASYHRQGDSTCNSRHCNTR